MKLDQVAVQLYTVRDLLQSAEAYRDTLKSIAEIGYKQVEFGLPGPISNEEIARLCQEFGLTIVAAHGTPDMVLNEPAAFVDMLNVLGCDIGNYPFPAGIDLADTASVDRMIDQLAATAEVLREKGKTFCYHNHNHEFRRVEGELILERIYRRIGPDLIKAELDTYWVQLGGGNPVDWCHRLKGRLEVLHLKDVFVNDQNTPFFAEIGSGNLDFRKIIAAAEAAGCRHFVVEQDKTAGNPLDSIRQSFEYIRNNLVEG